MLRPSSSSHVLRNSRPPRSSELRGLTVRTPWLARATESLSRSGRIARSVARLAAELTHSWGTRLSRRRPPRNARNNHAATPRHCQGHPVPVKVDAIVLKNECAAWNQRGTPVPCDPLIEFPRFGNIDKEYLNGLAVPAHLGQIPRGNRKSNRDNPE